MISLVLALILLWSFYIGYSRSLIVQSYYTVSCVVALIIATGSYQGLAGLLYLWVPFANATQGSSTYYFDEQYLFDLDKVFYAGLAFLLIYLLVYALMRLIGIVVHLLDGFSPDSLWANLVSGGLSVLVTLLSLQLVLTLLTTIPLAAVQERLHQSLLANAIIQYTPFTSSFLKELWMTNIIG